MATDKKTTELTDAERDAIAYYEDRAAKGEYFVSEWDVVPSRKTYERAIAKLHSK